MIAPPSPCLATFIGLLLHDALALLGHGEPVVLPPSDGEAGSTDAVAQPAE